MINNSRKYNIAIFASGTGSNFINIFDSINKGVINADISLLISNNSHCNAVIFARDNNINCEVINNTRYGSKEIANVMLEKLVNHKIDLIALAGYMKKIPHEVVDHYSDRILNIHPALLPEFGGKGFFGMRVHEAVIASKAEYTGVTIHIVDSEYDSGDIVYQEKIKILRHDTASSISKKVLDLEHKAYPRVIENFLENNIKQ